jgi:hypothetical protein
LEKSALSKMWAEWALDENNIVAVERVVSAFPFFSPLMVPEPQQTPE